MKLRKVIPLVALGLLAGAVSAEERHLGPHVHGQATVDVSVDGAALQVGLSIPGHDAVGFEHPPTSPEQVQTLAKANDALFKGAWLVPSAAAGCKLAKPLITANGFDAKAKAGGHADFDVAYVFTCANPDKLDALDVRLVAAFPTVQRVVVDVVTAKGANQQILDRDTQRVTLSP